LAAFLISVKQQFLRIIEIQLFWGYTNFFYAQLPEFLHAKGRFAMVL